MAVTQVVLVSQSKETDPDYVAQVAAALNRQVIDDFGPIWGVTATVHAFSGLAMMPPDAWLLVVKDDIGQKPGIAGFHLSLQGRPYALIQHSNAWPLAASHELLEMLVDPSGSQLITKRAPGDSPRKVQYLVEVCDPCQAPQDYHVNSIQVSDFITPQYYDPVAAPGVRYSFTGAITVPRTLLPKGYLCYREPETGVMMEWTFGNDPRPLGTPVAGVSLRTWVDARTSHPDLCGVPEDSHALATSRAAQAATAAASRALAEQLEEEIDALVGGDPPDWATD